MKRLLLTIAVLTSLHCPAYCQGDLPLFAVQEALRRGDAVQHVGVGNQDANQEAEFAAIGVPEDDSHKWFISVISPSNCKPCTQLLKDFETSSYLQAWADTRDPSASWSHFRKFDWNDKTQRVWRWTGFDFKEFPVIIIQPPITGKYGGDGSKCRPIVGYNGNPKQLAATIRSRIDEYLKQYKKANNAGTLVANSDANTGDKYGPPPFPVTEDEDSRPFNPVESDEMNSLDPASVSVMLFLASLLGSTLAPLLLKVADQVREWRKKQNLPVLNEELYQAIRKAVQSEIGQSKALGNG